jgi:hypothetical protein
MADQACSALEESDKAESASKSKIIWTGFSRHQPVESCASCFTLPTIRFLACSDAAIFIFLSESFSSLLIASLLVWIFCFTFFFHI